MRLVKEPVVGGKKQMDTNFTPQPVKYGLQIVPANLSKILVVEH